MYYLVAVVVASEEALADHPEKVVVVVAAAAYLPLMVEKEVVVERFQLFQKPVLIVQYLSIVFLSYLLFLHRPIEKTKFLIDFSLQFFSYFG
jgi:hypothetical protein